MADKYGQWVVKGTISEGGQARVYLVEDSTGVAKGQFALKRLKNIKRMDLFQREVEATRRLDHPNIVRVLDFDLGEKPYYVAEYCEGGSLADVGAGRFRGNIEEAARILLPIVNALNAAHFGGVIHRDVKPPNILFRKDGTPVLGDFGICFMEGDERVTLSDEAMGSRDYIAPEMETGGRRFGGPTDRTDVYSLGKVIYWMLSGGKMFAREDHRAHSLIELLRDKGFEHVHRWLLDGMIIANPRERISMAQVRDLLPEVASLIEGRFTPLRPSIGLQCRFCGAGTYERYAKQGRGGRASAAWFTNAVGNYSGCDLGVLRCGTCGHVEWFDFRDTKEAAWWDR